MADRSGRDLITAIRLGYEIYGRILDLGDPESPWDRVTVSGLVTAAMTGWLLRLPRETLTHALALAATHTTTLGEVRVGQVSGAKSIANAVVVQTASPCRLEAVLPGGQRIVAARAVTPGNAQAPLTWDEVKAKFHRCADGVLGDAAQHRVVDAVEHIDALPSTRQLLKELVPSQPRPS